MKKWLMVFGLWFMVVGNAAAFDACSKEYIPIAQRYNTGLFFIVQKCGQTPNYLMGTMHADDPKILDLHKEAIIKLENAKTALFEIKFDEEAARQTLAAMFYNQQSGMTLQKAIGNDLYKRFMSHITKPDPNNIYLKPWAAAVVLQYPSDVADGIPLDLRLQNFAVGKQVQVVGLETPQEQLSIFESMPVDEQIKGLKELLDNFAKSERIQDKMMRAYMQKDLQGLEALIPESIAISADKDAAKEFLQKMIYDRNIKMANRAEQYFAKGNSFMAVGALHLPSNKGLLKLFEDKGYKIEVAY